MGSTRILKFTAAVALCALGGAAALGCQAEAQLGGQLETPPPPPPPPPPPDGDGDGILDADDKCPTEKEDGKAPNANDGCPVKDTDGDGLTDDVDKCIDQPETKNDFEDEDGCPDTKPLVQLVGTEVRINQKIQFKHNSAAIEADSKPVLDAVADIMKKHADIQLIEVGGHASKEGDATHNKTLTQKRVDSVVKELTTRGIEKPRLMAQGYGYYCLLDEGATEEANEKNRRVEFKILVRGGNPTDQVDKRGCEGALKANIKPKPLPNAAPEKKATEAKPADKKPGDAKPAEKAAPPKPETATPSDKPNRPVMVDPKQK